MTSDNEDTGLLTRRPVVLDGVDNYNQWLRFISNLLLVKDLSNVADGTEVMPSKSSQDLAQTRSESVRIHWSIPFLRRSSKYPPLDLILHCPSRNEFIQSRSRPSQGYLRCKYRREAGRAMTDVVEDRFGQGRRSNSPYRSTDCSSSPSCRSRRYPFGR